MTQRVTGIAIQQTVVRAIEQATVNSGGPRLVPFTAAELRFIQEVVTQTLQEVLGPRRFRP